MERGRKIQSIVPDLRITIPIEGNLVPSLHEIKIISSCKTRYAPHRRGQEATKAVDIRAGQLHQSYVAKARATDRAYCGTPEDTVGPVERKLASMGEVEGLVVVQETELWATCCSQKAVPKEEAFPERLLVALVLLE